MTGLDHSPFAGLRLADYGDGLTARQRRSARMIAVREQGRQAKQARARAAGYGEGFALLGDGTLRCKVSWGKVAFLAAEAALARLVVLMAEQVADPANALDYRFGRTYRCDVADMRAHWHLTHWAADPPRGHAWPSPRWASAHVDPHLTMIPSDSGCRAPATGNLARSEYT